MGPYSDGNFDVYKEHELYKGLGVDKEKLQYNYQDQMSFAKYLEDKGKMEEATKYRDAAQQEISGYNMANGKWGGFKTTATDTHGDYGYNEYLKNRYGNNEEDKE